MSTVGDFVDASVIGEVSDSVEFGIVVSYATSDRIRLISVEKLPNTVASTKTPKLTQEQLLEEKREKNRLAGIARREREKAIRAVANAFGWHGKITPDVRFKIIQMIEMEKSLIADNVR